MKTIIFTLIAFLIATGSLFSQNPFSKNKTLEIDYYNYKATDFGITNSKNLIEINEKEYRLPLNSDELKLESTKNYQLKKGKITYRHYKSKYYESSSNYLYSKNYKTLEKRVYIGKKGNEVVSYKFDKKNRMIEIATSFKGKKNNTVIHLDYDDANNSVEKYTIGSGSNKYKLYSFKTNNKGFVISKTDKGTDFSPEDENRVYTYSNGMIESISKNKTLDGVIQKNSKASSNYKYNDKGLIINDKGDLTLSDFRFDHNYLYEYVYDKYGNWIVKYKFAQMYGYNDLEKDGYKGIKNVTMRKLTYKNGTSTGETDVTSAAIQNYLKEIVANNPFKTKKAPKKGDYWFRSSERAVKLYHDGDYIGSQSNLLMIIENDFYANDSINNVFYKLKDFMLKPENKEFYKAEVFVKNNEIVWLRSSEKAIKAYVNGASIVSRLNYHRIYGTGFYINDSITNNFYLLKDFTKNKIRKSFYKAIKVAKQDEVVWVKLENDNYTIVQNGKNITNSTKMVYAKNGDDVLIKINGKPKYAMLNARNASVNNFNKAILYNQYVNNNPNETKKEVIPNGFLWKKNKKEQFYIYKNGKVDPSKIKVVGFYQHQFVYDIDDNYSYLLENFENKEIEKYHTIKMLKGNAFYYKTNDNKIGVLINGKPANFSDSKYAENQIDVISKAKDSNVIYVLKNYKNVANETLGEVIIK